MAEPARRDTDTSRGSSADELVSFVPRLTLEWLRDRPDEEWCELEGTLAFVDISGFTAMAERLARFGKAGAEEVTDVMNATFEALLEIAYSYGGGLLKFGGDALLLLFSGSDHAARAARASYGMRRALRTVGRPRTSAGVVALRMHAGVHTGRFHFFLVGDSHRELLVTGPGATRTVEMEASSEAGEILLSPESAATLEPTYVGDAKGAGFLLAREPAASGGLEPLPDVSAIPLETAVPAPLRAQLLEVGPLEGEHRNAAIGFVRYTAVDERIGGEGPEAVARALSGLVRTIQAAAAEHEVTFLESDIDRDGGRIVLVAGAPQTAGDDEERLLRTLRAIVDAGSSLPLHVGASRGRVFAGQVGAPFRRTYTVLGDTAALAARLMARAGASEIFVAADAFERVNGAFAATELEPFTVKGKSEPVRAVALGSVASSGAVEPAEERLPFVDRERERAVLSASVAPVRMGFGSLVELVGEPGIGKSRLAEELRDQCGEMTTLIARCEQYESSTPYHVFRPLFRSLLEVSLNGGGAHNREVLSTRLAELDEELVPWAPLLAAPLDVEVEPTPEVEELDLSFRRARLHGLVGSLLGRLLDEPTLLLFEDVHWMDEASSELLRYLGTQLPTRPWLACTTRRPVDGGFYAAEGTPPLPAMTLRLEPLPADDAKKLVQAAAGDRSLTDDEVRAIAERGAGNPLFLQELAGADEQIEQVEELPESVEALVATRIDRLAPADRALLRWASVLGPAFSGGLITDVLEGDPSAAVDSESWDRLAEFIERDPAVAGGFRFRHALIRDAAYEGLSFRRRRELHGRVADVVERRQGSRADEAAEILSLHFLRAGRAAEAWRYSLEAGRRAQAKWSNVEAAEFYRRGLEASSSLPDLDRTEIARAWEALADCLQLSGDFENAAGAFASARRHAPKDGPEQVALMHKEGLLREDMGRYGDALRWYGRGFKAIERLPDRQVRTHWRIELSMAYAQTRFRQGEFRDCIRRCHEVVREALDVGDLENLAPAYLLLHLVHTILGSPERAAFRGLALPIYEELGDLSGQASVLNNMGIEAYYEGRWETALDLYRRSRELRERIGDVTNVAMTTNNIGEILSDQGHLEQAKELFADVVRACDAAGQRLLSTVARANLGRAAARAGRFDDAERLLDEAVDAFREIRAASFELETEMRRAELDTLRGDRAEQALAETAVLLGRDDAADAAPLQSSVHRIRAAAHLQLGDTVAGRAELDESLGVARAADAVYEVALALDLVAALDGDAGAAAESRSLLEGLGVETVARPALAADG